MKKTWHTYIGYNELLYFARQQFGMRSERVIKDETEKGANGDTEANLYFGGRHRVLFALKQDEKRFERVTQREFLEIQFDCLASVQRFHIYTGEISHFKTDGDNRKHTTNFFVWVGTPKEALILQNFLSKQIAIENRRKGGDNPYRGRFSAKQRRKRAEEIWRLQKTFQKKISGVPMNSAEYGRMMTEERPTSLEETVALNVQWAKEARIRFKKLARNNWRDLWE